MKKIIVCLLSLSFALPVVLSAQTYSPEDALGKFAKYPQERVFVHFDKGEYLAGETMHFKAYDFSKYQLSRIATNLYFECLDHDKKIVYKRVYPLAMGITEGAFSIPKALPENVYYFRAYTSWMLNFDEKFQFIQPINIYNPSSATRLVEQPAKWDVDVRPEGGLLLDKVPTNVAIRVRSVGDVSGQFSAYVFEGSDPATKVSDVTFYNSEIGGFSFTPDLGKKYNIKITDNVKNSKVIALQEVTQQGASLKIASAASTLNFQITSRGIEGLKDYKIVAHSRGELIYSAIIKNNSAEAKGAIDVDSLRGIVHVTLFDAKGSVAAERLCFANAEAAVSQTPAVDFVKTSRSERGLNQWNVEVDTLRPFTYAIEIANNDASATNDAKNLLNAFWLEDLSNPMLKGTYFTKDNPSYIQALDFLLMSEKWERFDWTKLLLHPVPKFKFFPDNYLSYVGSVNQGKRPVTNEKINLVFQAADSSKNYVMVQTDSVGNFKLDNVYFRDTVKVFYKINSLKNSSANIDIKFALVDNSTPYASVLPASPFVVVNRKQNDTVPVRIKEYAANLQNMETIEKGYQKLQDVVVSTKVKNAKDQLNKKLSTPLFNDPNQVMFDFINEEQDLGSSGVVDWMNGKVAGVTVDGGQVIMRGQAMKIYIDEFASDEERLAGLPLTEIALIKVLRSPFMLGSSTPVLAVYTKRGGLTKSDPLVETLHSVVLTGYPALEKFKTIEYNDNSFSKTGNDTRSVLYWNTAVSPEKDKEAIKFYNNDISKKLRLIVTGFSKTGSPVYLNKEISL